MSETVTDENLHPTIEDICSGCEDCKGGGCDGKYCQDFLNPAGK